MIFPASLPQLSNGNDIHSQDDYWMQQAIQLANEAAKQNEIPVGAILIFDDKIIGKGYNCSISHNDPTAHAEIMALRAGAQAVKNYRLINATLYVTLEPCIMCAGALVHARIKHLVYGAKDSKAGAIESKAEMLNATFLNHQITYFGGVMTEQCGELLSAFFQNKRKK